MQLATAYYGFREQSPTNYFEMAAALGLRYVEIPMYAHIIKDEQYNLRSVEAIDRLRATAEAAGVRLVASVSNLPLVRDLNLWGGTLDDSTLAFGMAAAHRVIDIAGQLGLEVVRITEPNLRDGDEGRAADLLERCGHSLRELAPHAEARGLRLLVENYGIRAEHLHIALATADHPAVGLLYDPCNFHRIGEDPAAALRLLRDYVAYVHLKDAFRNDPRDPNALFAGSRWAPSVAVGEGEIDWAAVLGELAGFYTGYLAIEYEMPADVMRGTRASLAHIRQTLHAISGSATPEPPHA